MIKAVLFDYGGVLKIGHPLSMDTPRIFNISQEEFGSLREKRADIITLGEKGLISDNEVWERLSKVVGKPAPKNAVELATKAYKDSFVFIKEMFELAKELRKKGIKTGILSNVYKFEADVVREKGGYKDFNPIILSCEVAMAKPDKDIYLFALNKLGVLPQECIFIDDKEKNVLAAKELGIKAVLFQNPSQVKKDFFDLLI